MKRDEGIKRLVRESTVRIDRCVDERILDEALPCVDGVSRGSRRARRTMMRRPVTRVAVAAVIALAIVLGLINVSGPGGGASAVYAAAMDHVRGARTFSCIEAFTVGYEHEGERGTYVLKQKLMFKEPDRERREQLTAAPPWPYDARRVTIWHYGERRRLEYKPFDKTAVLHDMRSDYTIDGETGELKLTELSTRVRDSLLELSAGAVEDLGKVELDGKSVRLLRSRKGQRVTTVWVEPKSQHPVQLEHRWADSKRAPVLFTAIEIDGALEDSLFSLDPPAGYALRVDKSGWPDEKEKMATKVMRLGWWCFVYANNHEDQFPETVADLVTAGVTTDAVLSRVLASPGEPNGPPAVRYRKPNMEGTDRGREVIFYEIYEVWPEDGVVACFADGHSELIGDEKRFEALIR